MVEFQVARVQFHEIVSGDALLVPEGIIRSVVSVLALT